MAASLAWYGKTTQALRENRCGDAAYAAGVLSHYYSDPLMPFHTGQTEEEGKVHRAAEWSIACAFGELQTIIEKDVGYPTIEVPSGPDWLVAMVRHGAMVSHPHYHALIDHYDLKKGVKNPRAGLDQECMDRVARCLAHAIVGFARILERALIDAAVQPPSVSLSLETFLATLKIPIRWVTQKLADAAERALVERIYSEVCRTGKVRENLPEDERTVRRLHAEEVLNVPLAELDAVTPRASGQGHGDGAPPRVRSSRPSLSPVRPMKPAYVSRPRGPVGDVVLVPSLAASPVPDAPPSEPASPLPIETPRPKRARRKSTPKKPVVESNDGPRFHLHLDSKLQDAPSIGAKSAKQFEAIGIRVVNDLLACDPHAAATNLGVRRIDATAVRAMQAQARLMCRVPRLRGHDAQVLVACDVTDAEALAAASPEELFARLEPYLATSAAQRLLRSSPRPDLDEVRQWIEWAKSSRSLESAKAA